MEVLTYLLTYLLSPLNTYVTKLHYFFHVWLSYRLLKERVLFTGTFLFRLLIVVCSREFRKSSTRRMNRIRYDNTTLSEFIIQRFGLSVP